MARVKLLTFDLDNTLWPVWEVIERAEVVLETWLGERFSELRQHLTSVQLRRWRNQLHEEHPHLAHDLTTLRLLSIERALESLGLHGSEAKKSARLAFEVFHEARHDVRLFEGVHDALQALSRSYVLGALTNGNADVRRVGLGDVFSFQFSSEMVHARKPAPEMFQAALLHARVHPSEAVHIGDHPIEDVQAAERVGMTAVWANPMGGTWPAELDAPRHAFAVFSELEELLGRLP